MKKKLLFVYNPQSGKGQLKGKLAEIIDIFTKEDYEITIYPTQAAKEARKIVAERAGEFDRVICGGGDGTLDEVVSGMMRHDERKAIGYIPAGSTNDFANSLELPKDLLKAAQVAVTGMPLKCDVGVMNGKYFIYIAAFGLFTDVSYGTPQEWKNVLGHAAYLLEGARSLTSIKSYQMSVVCNEERLEGDFIYGMITNSTWVGGFRTVTGKDVEFNDGLFEVTFIRRPRNTVEIGELVKNLTISKMDSELIYCTKTDKILIQCKDRIPWTIDGEFGGNHTTVKVTNEKQAVEILVPMCDTLSY